MNFRNKRFMTKGVETEIDPLLQGLMWSYIDSMPQPKDYLQVFKLSVEDKKQKIEHIQEEPEYSAEYLLEADTPFYVDKIFVIDDGTYSTMMLAQEY